MSKNIHDSVTILADRYLDQAVAVLVLPLLDEEAIHDLRVLTKQLRGLLRLYRKAVPKEQLSGINAALRDVARVFSAQRDAHVLVETLEQVASSSDKSVAAELRAIGQTVAEETRAVEPELAPTCLREDLDWVRSRWHELQQDDASFLVDALARSYRRGRKEGRRALRQRSEHELHEWRKQVKYFYYQLAVLNIDDEWLTQQKEQLRKLGSLLGKVHDLDVLAQYLRDHDQGDQPRLLRRVRKRRVRQVKKARALFKQAFSQSPKRYRRKLESS